MFSRHNITRDNIRTQIDDNFLKRIHLCIKVEKLFIILNMLISTMLSVHRNITFQKSDKLN